MRAATTRADPGPASKVPEMTPWFWLIKVMATTVRETAADLLSARLGLGLGVTSLVVAIGVVGTLVSDDLVDGNGVSLLATSVAFPVILAAVFAAWWRSEGSLSIHSLVTRRRHLSYWGAILFTFALGTSVGDLLAETLDLGYGTAAMVFGGLIAAVALALVLSVLAAGTARADCESDMLQLGAAMAAPNQSPSVRAALPAARTRAKDLETTQAGACGFSHATLLRFLVEPSRVSRGNPRNPA